eukprot:336209_1
MAGEVSEDVWTYSNISVMAIGASYCLVFTISLFYNYYANKKILNRIVYVAIIHALSWLIHFTISMTTYINHKNNHYGTVFDPYDRTNYIICIMIIIHPITFYIIMTLRAYVCQLNKYDVTVIMFSALIMIGSTMTEPICWTVIIFVNTPITPMHNIITYLWINIAFDIFTRLILVYFFTRKFFGIFMLQQTHPSDQMSNTCNLNDINAKEPSMIRMNTFQGKILNLIKKITLLSVVSILPLTISRIVFVFVYFINDGILTHKNWISFNAMQCMAVFIEILAIVLTFGFNSQLYQCMCKYCDLGCNKCCVVEAQRKIISGSDVPSISPVTITNINR